MNYEDLENRVSQLEKHNNKRWWVELALGTVTGAVIVLFVKLF